MLCDHISEDKNPWYSQIDADSKPPVNNILSLTKSKEIKWNLIDSQVIKEILLNGHSTRFGKNMNRTRWCKRHRCHDFHYTFDNVPDNSFMEKIENT